MFRVFDFTSLGMPRKTIHRATLQSLYHGFIQILQTQEKSSTRKIDTLRKENVASELSWGSGLGSVNATLASTHSIPRYIHKRPPAYGHRGMEKRELHLVCVW